MSDPYAKIANRADPYASIARPVRKKPTAKEQAKDAILNLPEGVNDTVRSTAGLLFSGFVGRMSPSNPLGLPTPMSFLSGSNDLIAKAMPRDRPQPKTPAGRVARTTGQMLPNALAPGSIPARIANVVIPTATTETAGGLAKAAGADEQGQQWARMAGGLVGGLAASVRPNALGMKPSSPAQVLADRAKLSPNALTMKAQEMRASGARPTLTDVVGDRGRRVIRAVGVRSEAGGEALATRAAEAKATAKPAVMSQARGMGPRVGETADEVAQSIRTVRDDAANVNYREPYQAPVSVTSETLRALSGAPGKAALQAARKAAVARMDDAQVAELDALIGAAGGAPPTQVSAGTMDRIRIAMREIADRSSANQQGAYASGVRSRMDIVDETLDKVPDIQPARADYRAKSEALGVLGRERRDAFSTDPSDYRRWIEGLSPEAADANQVAIRQEILDTLGGQRANTFGFLDELATSPYVRENLRAAFGPEEADALIAQVRARLEQARNADFVSPNSGSRTAVLENDVGNTAQQTVGAVRQGLSGDLVGLAARAVDAWLRRGISEQKAEELARIAVDPNQTDDAIRAIAAWLEPGARQQLLELRSAALVGSAAGMAGFRANPEDEPYQ